MAPKIKFQFQPVVDIDSLKANAKQIQELFGKLKLAPNLSDELKREIDQLFKSIEAHEKNLSKNSEGLLNTAGLARSGKEVERTLGNVTKSFKKIKDIDLKNSFNIDTSQIQELEQKLQNIHQVIINESGVSTMFKTLQQDVIAAGDSTSAMIIQLKQLNSEADFTPEKFDNTFKTLQSNYTHLQQQLSRTQGRIQTLNKELATTDPGTKQYDKLSASIAKAQKTANVYSTAIKNLNPILEKMKEVQQQIPNAVKDTQQQIEYLKEKGYDELTQSMRENISALEDVTEKTKHYDDENVKASATLEAMQRDVDGLINRFASFATISGQIAIFSKVVRQAYSDVKELDAIMSSIASVSEYTISELWEQSNAYASMASNMGTTISGAYEVAKLYYQQGRETADVTNLTQETLKLARLAELDYADATDYMTVALNGYNMAASEASHVTDVYSKLASKAAVSQSEIAVAMSKTASLAANTGMSFENTSAFLSRIIEATRNDMICAVSK